MKANCRQCLGNRRHSIFEHSCSLNLKSNRPLFPLRPPHAPHSQRPFADFLEQDDSANGSSMTAADKKIQADKKAEELIARTAAVLASARAALEDTRNKQPADSLHRRYGPDILQTPIETIKSASAASLMNSGGARTGTLNGTAAVSRPAPTSLSFAWESDNDDDDDGDDFVETALHASSPSLENTNELGRKQGSTKPSSSSSPSSSSLNSSNPSSSSSSSSPSLSSIKESTNGPTSLDSWFGGKVDTGNLQLRKSQQQQQPSVHSIAVLERPVVPSSLEFGIPVAPEESKASSIFPESMALRFQSDVIEEEEVVDDKFDNAVVNNDQGEWQKTSGEEFGPDGYWYRWTEISGQDSTGTIQWTERWWEASDWKGMKEMGAEKWGVNNTGDAWRETWRECIGFDASSGQPTVERSAHKWAHAAAYDREWEEKWNESYWSAGKAEKWADKWGKEGGESWHERWGETYDGDGGCVKWTDRWAERPDIHSYGLEKWGDKWEESFKHGQGSKKGETWSEAGHGDKYQRWWGENHFGDGRVQRFGHSTTGENWDNTETMDTYYNPIPHFGYDLALAHSPQLRNVPMLPRDDVLDVPISNSSGGGASKKKERKPKKKTGGGGGGGDNDNENGLSSIFG